MLLFYFIKNRNHIVLENSRYKYEMYFGRVKRGFWKEGFYVITLSFTRILAPHYISLLLKNTVLFTFKVATHLYIYDCMNGYISN